MSLIEPMHSQRLRLRPLTLQDGGFILSLVNQPEWLAGIGDRKVRDRHDAEQFLLQGPLKSYREHGLGLLLIELAGSCQPVGVCGLLQRDFLDAPDLGYALDNNHFGKGYALEACQTVLQSVSSAAKYDRVLAFTSPENNKSIALLNKLGFICQGKRVLGEWSEPSLLFSRDNPSV